MSSAFLFHGVFGLGLLPSAHTSIIA
jgi:hypothetical protein